MITVTTIDSVIRSIRRMNKELILGEFDVIWSQDLFDMLYSFLKVNAFEVHHKELFYMGIKHRKGRKDMKGDFSVKYL